MKHTFLLDENIIYLGIRGVNKHNKQDPSASEFLTLLAQNCHRIVVDKEINRRILDHLSRIQREKDTWPIPYFGLFLIQIFHNSEKFIRKFEETPPLINEEKVAHLVRKDIHILRAANYFNAIIVTEDDDLIRIVTTDKNLKKLGLRALKVKDAICLAKERD
jgi:hypothetical protein